MFDLIIAAMFFAQPDELGKLQPVEKPVPKMLPLEKFPRALMVLSVGNATDGKGWVKLDDILVDLDGTGYVKKSAKMWPSETPDHKICVRIVKGAVAIDLFAYYVWEATPVSVTADLIEVKEIHLKFREPR